MMIGAGDLTQWHKCLPSKYEIVSSIPGPKKKDDGTTDVSQCEALGFSPSIGRKGSLAKNNDKKRNRL